MNLLARLISAISNPLVVSFPMSYAILFKWTGEVFYSIQWSIVSFVFSIVMALFVFYGILRGFFSDYDISNKEERGKMFLFAGILSILYLILTFVLNGPKVLIMTLGGLILGIFIANLINYKIKASVHLAVFAAFSLILGILYGGIFWVILLLTPIIAWSRIKLKKHVLKETVVGVVLGGLLVIILYFVIKYLYNYA